MIAAARLDEATLPASRIIVVEDERIVALDLKKQLSKLGYDVVAVAASGEAALERILALRPDLVLMDVHIEGAMDGIDTAGKIPAFSIPVVYITAYSDEATLDRARVTKPYGYIVKPCSERELHATIQMALERHRTDCKLQAAELHLERMVEERSKALRQSDLLLREVYHRVKNNLQVVDSLIMMQARNLDDPAAKTALHDLSGRIFALGLVHQQLMGSDDLKTFDVVPFLHELSKNVLEGGGTDGVKLTVEACPLDVGLDFAVPLGLVVTELVTNSLKHAFPQGKGNIYVTLRHDAVGKLVLTVSDDGGAPGTPIGPPKPGLGTGIINSLVSQLEGSITVRRENGMRTEIRLAMPTAS